MITAERFGGRAGIALALFKARGERKPTHAELADAVAVLAGEPVTGSQVQSWLAGKFFPVTMTLLWAFARALKVDPGWLTFGEESAAPAPVVASGAPMPKTDQVTAKPRGAQKRRRHA